MRDWHLLALAAMLLSGCGHALHRPVMTTSWVDFNIYGRPCFYVDKKFHVPQHPHHAHHVRHFHWLHGPHANVFSQEAALPMGSGVPSGEYAIPGPGISGVPTPGDWEEAPAPRESPQAPVRIEVPHELLPPYSAPTPTLPPPPVPRAREDQESRRPLLPRLESQEQLLTPPAPTGPTAQQWPSPQRLEVKPTAWNRATTQLPGTGVLFARP